MDYQKDELGKEILLKDGSLQVMMEWEKPYIEACIDRLKPEGDVLEIGFGLGYSATRVQHYHPKSHTIIDSDPLIIKKAKEWAKKYPTVKIIEGKWEDKLKELATFDAIFFDDYTPLSTPLSASEVKEIEANAQALNKVQGEAKKLTNDLSAALKKMKGIKFTNEQVNEFTKVLLSRPGVLPDDVMSFMTSLAEQGNITTQQEVMFLDEYEKQIKHKGKENKKQPSAHSNSDKNALQKTPQHSDRLFNFFQLCIHDHLRKGSRISSFIDFTQFKKRKSELDAFLKSHPEITHTEEIISIEVPSNCQYYAGNEALVLILRKK